VLSFWCALCLHRQQFVAPCGLGACTERSRALPGLLGWQAGSCLAGTLGVSASLMHLPHLSGFLLSVCLVPQDLWAVPLGSEPAGFSLGSGSARERRLSGEPSGRVVLGGFTAGLRASLVAGLVTGLAAGLAFWLEAGLLAGLVAGLWQRE